MFVQQTPQFEANQQPIQNHLSPQSSLKARKKTKKHRSKAKVTQPQPQMWNPYSNMQPMHHFPYHMAQQPYYTAQFNQPCPIPYMMNFPQNQETMPNGNNAVVNMMPPTMNAVTLPTPVETPQKKLRTETGMFVTKSSDSEASSTSGKSHKKPRKAKRKCLSASSKFKGVSWHKRDRCYMARVWVDGASKHIGSYQQEMRAALAVDYTLISMGKDETHLNFPGQLERDLAASILKNQTVSQEVLKTPSKGTISDSDDSSSVSTSDDENSAKGLDRNGFPNCIESILSKLLENISERKKDWETKALKAEVMKSPKKEETEVLPKSNPMWDTLVEVASKQNNFEVKQNEVETIDEAPAGSIAVPCQN